MELINGAVNYILSFKPYVMLPMILLLISLLLGLKLAPSLKACLSIGIGFIGIFLVFDYFVAAIGPATKAIVERTGLHYNALDVGWPPLASIAWSFKLAPLMILFIILVNVLMLVFRLTRVINIDIWNYWHFLMVGSLVYSSTKSIPIAIISIAAAEIFMLKVGDIAGPYVSRYANVPGITITTLSAGGYFPAGLIGNSLIDRIPFINKLEANPETIQKKLGIFGEPSIIGFLLGTALALGGGYSFKQTLELAFTVSAVIMILPLMCGILTRGLLPISEGMKEYVQKKFPHAAETYIGMDNAILQGDTAVIVTGLLLMPLAMILAFVLPGVRFIPIGDLANIIALGTMIVVVTGGNVIRAVIISVPLIVAQLYIASFMTAAITRLSAEAGFKFAGYDGDITSFFDGGLIQRFWLVKFFEGNIVALALLPLVVAMFWFCYRTMRKEFSRNEKPVSQKSR